MAFGWFTKAMLSQIVDPIGKTSKNQEPTNVAAEKADFITIPKKNNNSAFEEFQAPLHYPRYKKEDYEKMDEWKIDQLLRAYGLVVNGSLGEKRDFAMGAFLWPDQM